MALFGNYDMPLWYKTGAKAEHLAVIGAAGIFDTSHMAAVAVQGAGARELLQLCLSADPKLRSAALFAVENMLRRGLVFPMQVSCDGPVTAPEPARSRSLTAVYGAPYPAADCVPRGAGRRRRWSSSGRWSGIGTGW